MPTVHVKKCHPGAFAALRGGYKTFEWRQEDDCTYAVDDLLVLLEWEPSVQTGTEPVYEHGCYTGEHAPVMSAAGYTGEVLKRRVTYVLRSEFGVPEGYAVLSLKETCPACSDRGGDGVAGGPCQRCGKL